MQYADVSDMLHVNESSDGNRLERCEQRRWHGYLYALPLMSEAHLPAETHHPYPHCYAVPADSSIPIFYVYTHPYTSLFFITIIFCYGCLISILYYKSVNKNTIYVVIFQNLPALSSLVKKL